MKRALLSIFIYGLLASMPVFSQTLTPTAIASGGGFYTSASGSLSLTIAEMSMVETFASATHFLTQGMQQPEDWAASVDETTLPEGNIVVYPNPGNGNLTLSIVAPDALRIRINVLDFLGQWVYSDTYSPVSGSLNQSIDISSNGQGIYFMQVSVKYLNGKEDIRTIKINVIK